MVVGAVGYARWARGDWVGVGLALVLAWGVLPPPNLPPSRGEGLNWGGGGGVGEEAR